MLDDDRHAEFETMTREELIEVLWAEMFRPPPRVRGETRIRLRFVPKDEWIEGMRKAGDLGYGHVMGLPFTWDPRWDGPLERDRPSPEVRRRVLSPSSDGDRATEGEGAEES